MARRFIATRQAPTVFSFSPIHPFIFFHFNHGKHWPPCSKSALIFSPAARSALIGPGISLFFLLQEEEADAHFEPVIKLTEQVDTKTHEEDEEVRFKMYVCPQPDPSSTSSQISPSLSLPADQACQIVPIRCSLVRVEGTWHRWCSSLSAQRDKES